MRSLLDTEEIEDGAPEITLSTASVLGIFFGLVLICGVFFGFGYSMGRGAEMGTQVIKIGGPPVPAVKEAEEPSPAEDNPAAATVQHAAQIQATPPAARFNPPVAPESATTQIAANQTAANQAANQATGRSIPRKPSPVLQAATVDQPATIAANMSAPSGTGQAMVQIAAVARPQDAEVLVSALRQRGYGVSVRSEPQDRLLHVQVGPFADHTQAMAMKQKLMKDGYNAIIKE